MNSRYSEHEYEPISPPSSSSSPPPPPSPSLPHPAMAPVVRIADTDVRPVADSDDSIDDHGRLPAELILDGDVVLPLDGKIEDSAMEGRELGETGGDTSEEQEPQARQPRDGREERPQGASTRPRTESRTDGEVDTSQVDSPAMEEEPPPPRQGARGLPQRLRTEAGKLRTRLRDLQRPAFTFPRRQKKPEKTTTRSVTTSGGGGGKSDKPRPKTETRPSRMDRIRTSISERSARFSLPERPRFSLPDRSKFHLPERPKFSFPDRSRFHLPDRPKFAIRKPCIRLPDALARVKRPPSQQQQQQQQQRSTESTAGSAKRNIFDFATYPRIFDKKSKKRGEYATSSPKDSRAQSAESATLPSARKGRSLGARWTRPFGDSSRVQDQDRTETTATVAAVASNGTPPWRQTSMEEPRLSARTEEEIMAAASAIPWEETRKREQRYDEEEIQYMDYEQESSREMSAERHPPPRRSHELLPRRQEASYEHEEATEVDPRLYDDRETKRAHRDETDEEDAAGSDWRADQQMIIVEETFRPIPRSLSLDEDMPRVMGQAGYERIFLAVDPRLFGLRKTMSREEEEEEEMEDRERGPEEDEEEREPSSARSDREQQHSSSSSCVRRRRGVIEEIDSDEFFLRESGISQDDMNLGNYLTDEIRDALRSEIVSALQGGDDDDDNDIPPTPPQRPVRTRSLRKRKEALPEANEVVPPPRPKRERAAAARRSREASIVDEVFRERTRSDSRSDSRHRVVYQAEGGDRRAERSQEREPLDDIVVVKPARRKSRSSLRSQSQPPMETLPTLPPTTAVIPVPVDTATTPFSSKPPAVPLRRKRSHRETVIDRRNGDLPICNGRRERRTEIVTSRRPVTPVRPSRSRQSLTERLVAEDGVVVASASQEEIAELDAQIQQEDSAPEATAAVAPVPPKRRSRSRTSIIAADDDRTSHGAESLPEAGYAEEDIPRDETGSTCDLSGYAIVEKRERPPRPPPPRRKRDKFATAPRPVPPKRPQRAYSTLGPATRSKRDADIFPSAIQASETTIVGVTQVTTAAESTPYIELDSDDGGERDRDAFFSGEVLDKIQARPLPAPPRPPRARREHTVAERTRTPFEFATEETTAATQTDPLPDDMVIEEEITQAKLTVTPSRSGSQVTVSMERIPSPSGTGTPPVPPLPISQKFPQKKGEEMGFEDARIGSDRYDTMSLTSPSPTRDHDLENRHMSAPHLEREVTGESRPRPVRTTLASDEPWRISSLEVGDLKVDRLSVSQIEAHKIMASEVDALVIAASELRGVGSIEESLSPAIIKELIAIRSHLESVASSQTRERYRESEKEPALTRTTDIPPPDDDSRIRERRSSREAAVTGVTEAAEEPMPTGDDGTPVNRKVVKTDHLLDVKDREVPHTVTVAQAKVFPSLKTLAIDQLESRDRDRPVITTHPLTVTAQDTQDKSLRILDSEHPVTLSARTTPDSHVGQSRASFPPSSDSPASGANAYEYMSESSSTVQITTTPTTTTTTTAIATTATTTATTTTVESNATSTTGLRGSKDDVSDSKERTRRKSRSRSPSPVGGITRQTASPVRSLPPVISVTPDTPDPIPRRGTPIDARPQRAVISYSSDAGGHGVPPKDAVEPQRAVISQSYDTLRSLTETQRESSQSPVSPFPPSTTHFIAFPASEVPARFYSLSETPTSQRTDSEPGVIDTTQQLLRALRSAGIRATRHFVSYLASALSTDDPREKVREVELAICALLLLIAGLLIYYFASPGTVTHYHHWDYFNPPQ